MRVALLSGGTGGAKLAAGLYGLLGDELTVIANTGDDIEVYGVHVSPDPDLVTYWLAGTIDERGWGIAGDTFEVMAGLEAAGHPAWFRLGDRDLSMCMIRTEALRAGSRLTDAHAAVVTAAGVEARVLPMSDTPVATRVRRAGRWLPLQEFMIVERASGPIEQVEFAGAAAARPTPEVLAALAEADAIVVGPSNPIISIGPILAIPGIRAALAAAAAPVIAVSPFVGGEVVKGPTAAFMTHAGYGLGAAGVLAAYGDLIDALVADEPLPAGTSGLTTETLMSTPEERRRLAEATIGLARRG